LLAATGQAAVATTALVATGADYDLGVFTSRSAQVTVDVAGWFV
jgi:hypothetical protein